MKYLKKADKTAESNVLEAQKVVHDMLSTIDKNGEKAVRDYAERRISPVQPSSFSA
jgi:sulfopropanediol 3-dehydrogenase